ncbi:MAG TPA: hypothetical protein VE996_14005 [Terriglobales bacterium]|jgi:glucose/arabinose dehydrogenase|nr:hypothetical protein [Terriglobales bacterium]
MTKTRPLAVLVMLLACTGWLMAQQTSNPDQQQGQQSSQSQQAQPSQQQQQAPAGQQGQQPSQSGAQQEQTPSATPSAPAGTGRKMPATGSPLGLLVLLGVGAVGAGTAIKRRAH